MDWYRIRHTAGMYLTLSPMKRAQYLGKNHIFRSVGDNCMVMFRKIPLYPELISLGNNVWIASQVTFVTHDVIHHMLNYYVKEERFKENIGCIDIKDNVFVGSNTTLLPNISIGPNAIIAAGSLVNKSVGSGVYAGNPAKYICSFEDFMAKRDPSAQLSISRSKAWTLSQKTADACWEALRKKEDKHQDGNLQTGE